MVCLEGRFCPVQCGHIGVALQVKPRHNVFVGSKTIFQINHALLRVGCIRTRRIAFHQATEQRERQLTISRRTLVDILSEKAFEHSLLTFEMRERLDINCVVDACMDRIFTNERVRSINGLFDTVIHVIGVGQLELNLCRKFTERKAGLQCLKNADRLAVVADRHRLLRLDIRILNTRRETEFFLVAGAASSNRQRQHRCKHQQVSCQF